MAISIRLTIAFAVVALCDSFAFSAEFAPRPNIIVILSDDMGYSDLGCMGGEIRTPNLDALAKGGLRFTQFYNTARCCPTRACLLSGLYPHQAGVGHMTENKGHPGYTGGLNRSCVTMAEVLRAAGYGTYAVGKWHVVRNSQIKPDGLKDNWPLQRGFDRFYGTIAGGGSFFDPGTLTRDNTMVSPFADPEYPATNAATASPRPAGEGSGVRDRRTAKPFYYTEAISDHAIRFVRDHRKEQPSQPFFLYVAYTAAHWPMHALEEDVAKYRGKYDGGYEPIRLARLARMKELGLVDSRWDLSPEWGDWSKVKNREWEARCMEVYAAMIDRMDQGTGRLVGTLSELGQLDNTLILYMQDNGGCQETIGRDGDMTRPDKPTLPAIAADAIRLDVRPKQNRLGVPTLQGENIFPGPEDTFIAYGQGWANVSNTPFREYKHFVHEGGVSTPLIAHWPARIKRRGEFERQPGHLVDIMATCVDVSGASYPRRFADHDITPREGVSLAAAFDGQPLGRTNPIFWEHEGNRAIRDGNWKLVAKEDKPWELYDLEADRTEQHDLAESQPNRVRLLAANWEAWAKRANVLPVGTWKAKPPQ
jgi:arylsulfatase